MPRPRRVSLSPTSHGPTGTQAAEGTGTGEVGYVQRKRLKVLMAQREALRAFNGESLGRLAEVGRDMSLLRIDEKRVGTRRAGKRMARLDLTSPRKSPMKPVAVLLSPPRGTGERVPLTP